MVARRFERDLLVVSATEAWTGSAGARKARLPWYDFDFLRQDHQALWQNLRDRLIALGVSSVPTELAMESDRDEILASPALLLSQTCGYDIAVPRPVRLRPVLTPVYSAPGCSTGTYSSYIVVARDSRFVHTRELSCVRFVANDDRSWSGFHCVREIGATWASVHFSGGHLQSLRAIANAEADWAAIDSIDWALLRDHDRLFADQFRILGSTREVPAPPLVTSMQTEDSVLGHLRNSLRAIVTDPTMQHSLRRLRISGFIEMPSSAYEFMDLDRRPCHKPTRISTIEALSPVNSFALLT